MPLRKNNTRRFYRKLFGGQTETVRLHKREPDMRAGVISEVILRDCRWEQVHKSGQQLDAEVTSEMSRVLHVPRESLDVAGVNYVNLLFEFIDKEGRWWEPESGQTIESKMFENHLQFKCLRIDPPGNQPIRR